VVQGLDTDGTKVAAARQGLLAAGAYGPVTIDRWDGRRLPYVDGFVNLLVAEDPAQADQAEILRVLAPNGVALIREGEQWRRTAKPWPAEMDEWTHYLHGPEGNPAGRDTLVGPPTRLQWLGSPAWARHHDHMASMTSLVSAGGRLFYILDEGSRTSIRLPSHWRLIARDAFNGTVLWKREIPEWASKEFALKSGPAHLLRRLVAVGERVYVTLGIDAPVSVLDAATGEDLATCENSAFTGEIVVAEDTALLVADLQPSRLPAFRRVGTYVWSNTQAANSGWGWNAEPRNLVACDAVSGKARWQRQFPIAPCSLTANADLVVFHDGQKLVCLDRRSGQTRWEGEPAPVKVPVPSSTGPRVLIYRDRVLFAGNDGRMSGWELATGRKAWEQPHKPSGHSSLKDLFVVGGLVWTAAIAGSGDDGVWTGYDPLTGEQKREFAPDVQLHWFHHRCYPSKASGQFIVTGRNGTEYVDLKAEHWTPNHWFRGGCIYGVMPCNGMTYASMDACGCQLEAKLSGFKAMRAAPLPQPSPEELAGNSRLERGPAYGTALGVPTGVADWPTFRHDPARSGATPAAVAAEGPAWTATLGGRLTAPTIAAGRLFVADRETHTIRALAAATGQALWSYTTGGQTDTPPTYHDGLLFLGSADGYVYALRAEDGALAWRFRAAPVDQRLMAWEQLESVWPVHGSVLVLPRPDATGATVYCTAGRSLYLDGGIRFLRLDAVTGELLGEAVWDEKDPESGKSLHEAYLKKTPGNTMPVGLSDVLSYDGRSLWMRSQKIDLEGRRSELAVLPATDQPAEDAHLFCQVGLTDESCFFRSYWTYGRRMVGGYGGWYQAGRIVPAGRILCFDDQAVYGYGQKPEYMVNASLAEYQLFAARKTVAAEDIARVAAAERRMNQRRPEKGAGASDWRLRWYFPREELTATRFGWVVDQPSVFGRAMCVAGDRLFVAGPPDVVDERQAYHSPDDPQMLALLERQEAAYAGRLGGRLWVVDKGSGQVLDRRALDAVPVFDGLAAAGGRLYLTTVDGRVLSYALASLAELASLSDQPEQTRWDSAEDPAYLKPLPEPRDADFAVVSGCKVFASDLGYRLQANAEKTVGTALKRLEAPLTGSVTFRTRFRAVPEGEGRLRNGFLAFGDSTDEAALIKCGVRLQTQVLSIVQGPLLGGGKAGSSKVEAPEAKGLDAQVTVDLTAQTVRVVGNGVTLEAPMAAPLKAITVVGYVMDSALIDVAPVGIEAR
jgi:outer membrane protein assembly factor BamB